MPKALPPDLELKRLLTLKKTSEIMDTSIKTVRRRIHEGALLAIRDGRTLRVHPDDLARYIAERRGS